MKTKLTEVVERAAVEAAELKFKTMNADDVDGAQLDLWQDEAIEACLAFGLAYGSLPSAAGVLVDNLCDAFVDAFEARCEQLAIERAPVQPATSEEIAMGLSREVAGRHVVPVDPRPLVEQLELTCAQCGGVVATSELAEEPAEFICDDCAAGKAGIPSEDVPSLRAIAEPASSACKRQPWCNLQVGHEGECSASFMADGTVIS